MKAAERFLRNHPFFVSENEAGEDYLSEDDIHLIKQLAPILEAYANQPAVSEGEDIIDILCEHIGPTDEEMENVTDEGWPEYNERILSIVKQLQSLNVQGEEKRIFIRFGNIPQDGKSKIHNGDEGVIGKEIGVSVYEAIQDGGNIKILIPKNEICVLVSMSGCFDKPAFLVEGDIIGTGSDGEPLLRNVKIINSLEL